jgi:dTMP kinase
MNKACFITIEGGEGCGKSTQSLLLFEHIKTSGIPVIHTREPGGTIVAETIRTVLLNPENRISPVAELLLYEASRAQHIEEVIMPAPRAGTTVICDRFTDATLAYQGYGRGIDLAVIRKLNAISTGGLTPDLTIYLDLPAATGVRKAKALNKDSHINGDRLEREALSFHAKVRNGYRALAARYPRRIMTVRTAATAEKTHQAIVTVWEEFLQHRKKASHAL